MTHPLLFYDTFTCASNFIKSTATLKNRLLFEYIYRVFLKKVLHKREKNARKNEDDLADRWKFGTSTTTM